MPFHSFCFLLPGVRKNAEVRYTLVHRVQRYTRASFGGVYEGFFELVERAESNCRGSSQELAPQGHPKL